MASGGRGSWAIRLAHLPSSGVVAQVENARQELLKDLQDLTGPVRTAATAARLGQQATVFPSHHGGFMGGEFGYPGQPEAFARKLRDVLDAET